MTVDRVLEHLYMVLMAVLLTVAAGVPLGVCTYFFPKVRRLILTVVEILQTIPAMAMLGIIMIFLGAGKTTVIIGLLLYSLLPVVQNTYIGLNEVDPGIKEAATGMGMTKMYKLLHVELPIALPFIFTGIRIATVTAVGTAVFAASVGGGGLGSVINRAISVQKMDVILQSTAVLMAMAVVFDVAMGAIEKYLHKRFSAR